MKSQSGEFQPVIWFLNSEFTAGGIKISPACGSRKIMPASLKWSKGPVSQTIRSVTILAPFAFSPRQYPSIDIFPPVSDRRAFLGQAGLSRLLQRLPPANHLLLGLPCAACQLAK